jgi:hypothetical protein
MIRKLSSKEEEERKRKRNQWVIGIILIVVMLGSTFAVIVDSFGNKNKTSNNAYNGHEFLQQGSYWYTQIGEKQFIFMYTPYEVQESFNVSYENITYINSYKGYPLYVYSEDYSAENEIFRNFDGISLRMQRACLNDSNIGLNCSETLPIKDCSNNFIIIKESNIRSIYEDGKCVFITGQKEDLIKLTDEYLFKITGIKE